MWVPWFEILLKFNGNFKKSTLKLLHTAGTENEVLMVKRRLWSPFWGLLSLYGQKGIMKSILGIVKAVLIVAFISLYRDLDFWYLMGGKLHSIFFLFRAPNFLLLRAPNFFFCFFYIMFLIFDKISFSVCNVSSCKCRFVGLSFGWLIGLIE